jgi:hypothetical protein
MLDARSTQPPKGKPQITQITADYFFLLISVHLVHSSYNPGLAGGSSIQRRASSIGWVGVGEDQIRFNERFRRDNGHFDRILRSLKLRATGRRAGGRTGPGVWIDDAPDRGLERRFSYQLSAISYQLSAISYQLSEGIVSTLSFVKVCSSGQSILIPAMS